MAASAGERLSIQGAASISDVVADAGEGDCGALHVAQVLGTLELKDSCSHCGKHGAAHKLLELDLQASLVLRGSMPERCVEAA